MNVHEGGVRVLAKFAKIGKLGFSRGFGPSRTRTAIFKELSEEIAPAFLPLFERHPFLKQDGSMASANIRVSSGRRILSFYDDFFAVWNEKVPEKTIPLNSVHTKEGMFYALTLIFPEVAKELKAALEKPVVHRTRVAGELKPATHDPLFTEAVATSDAQFKLTELILDYLKNINSEPRENFDALVKKLFLGRKIPEDIQLTQAVREQRRETTRTSPRPKPTPRPAMAPAQAPLLLEPPAPAIPVQAPSLPKPPPDMPQTTTSAALLAAAVRTQNWEAIITVSNQLAEERSLTAVISCYKAWQALQPYLAIKDAFDASANLVNKIVSLSADHPNHVLKYLSLMIETEPNTLRIEALVGVNQILRSRAKIEPSNKNRLTKLLPRIEMEITALRAQRLEFTNTAELLPGSKGFEKLRKIKEKLSLLENIQRTISSWNPKPLREPEFKIPAQYAALLREAVAPTPEPAVEPDLQEEELHSTFWKALEKKKWDEMLDIRDKIQGEEGIYICQEAYFKISPTDVHPKLGSIQVLLIDRIGVLSEDHPEKSLEALVNLLESSIENIPENLIWSIVDALEKLDEVDEDVLDKLTQLKPMLLKHKENLQNKLASLENLKVQSVPVESEDEPKEPPSIKSKGAEWHEIDSLRSEVEKLLQLIDQFE